jgi:hypothetical protein
MACSTISAHLEVGLQARPRRHLRRHRARQEPHAAGLGRSGAPAHRAPGADSCAAGCCAANRGEGAEIGVAVKHCRDGSEIPNGACIVITNYDRLHRFDPSMFGAVVLDESSCIKHHDAKTLRTLLEAFRDTPFKLCATATPAPNDWTELGTHAEFLGVCTRAEMLAEYFTHDGGDTSVWR